MTTRSLSSDRLPPPACPAILRGMSEQDYADYNPKRRLPSLSWLAVIGVTLAAVCGGVLTFIWWAARSFGIDD